TFNQVIVQGMRLTQASSINYLQSGVTATPGSWAEWRVTPYSSSTWYFRVLEAGIEAAGTVSDADGNVRNVPQRLINGGTTLTLADAGRHIASNNNTNYIW